MTTEMIRCNIVSVDKEIFDGDVKMVIATGVMGELGITVNHAPFLTQLYPGSIRIICLKEERVYYISGGYIEVQPKIVTVLADKVLLSSEIDEHTIREEARAKKELVNKKGSFDYDMSIQLAEAAAKLRTINVEKRISKDYKHQKS